MPISKNAEHREYAQFAMDCLYRMVESTSETDNDREREMALEWIRRADAVLPPVKAIGRIRLRPH
jgi:hypothetical protein